MSGDVLYSDVKFVKKGKGPSSSNQEDVTYSEVRTPKPTKVNSPQDDDVTYSMVTIAPAQRKAGETEREEEPTYSEVQKGENLRRQNGSQPNSPPGKSNTKKRVAIGVLIVLLVLAIILIAIGLNINEWTKGSPTTPNFTEPVLNTIDEGSPCPSKLHCDTGWKLNGTKCYNFSTTKSPWNQSRGTCKAMKGDLVKIDSREEQRFLFHEVSLLMKKAEDKFWIGLTDAKIEGEWRWVDDTPLNQSLLFWFESVDPKDKREIKEPDNWTDNNNKPEGEDCVRMGELGEDYVEKCWFDLDCSFKQRFICEKEAIKTPDCQNN